MDRREGTGNHLPPFLDVGRGDGGRGRGRGRGDFDSLFMILPSSLHPHGCNCEHCDARRSVNNFNQSVENVPQQPSFPRQIDIDLNVVASQQEVDMTLRRRGTRRNSDSVNVGSAVTSSPGLNSGQGQELATQSESVNSGLSNRARPQCHTINLVKKFTQQLLSFRAGQGEFKILTLSGTFIPGEEGAADMERANLAVSACSVDGGVVGGSVEGEEELIAGDTLEVTLCTFS